MVGWADRQGLPGLCVGACAPLCGWRGVRGDRDALSELLAPADGDGGGPIDGDPKGAGPDVVRQQRACAHHDLAGAHALSCSCGRCAVSDASRRLCGAVPRPVRGGLSPRPRAGARCRSRWPGRGPFVARRCRCGTGAGAARLVCLVAVAMRAALHPAVLPPATADLADGAAGGCADARSGHHHLARSPHRDGQPCAWRRPPLHRRSEGVGADLPAPDDAAPDLSRDLRRAQFPARPPRGLGAL